MALTLTLPDIVAVGNVYGSSRGLGDRVVLAINIGTTGFYWWDRPQLSRRFYESCIDLQSSRPIVFTENPSTETGMDMMSGGESHVVNALFLMGALPFPFESEEYAAFGTYLEGLSFFATINVVRRHEYYTFCAFYDAYWQFLNRFAEGLVERTVEHFIAGLPPQFQAYDCFSILFSKGERLLGEPPDAEGLTISDVAWMKRVFDLSVTWLVRNGNSLRAPDHASGIQD